MEIAFASKELRDICEIQLKAEHALGMVVAANLRARLADLREVAAIEDMPTGAPTIHDAPPPGRATVDLGEGYGLILCANHVKNPVSAGGKVDWQRVSRIKVIDIANEGRHGV